MHKLWGVKLLRLMLLLLTMSWVMVSIGAQSKSAPEATNGVTTPANSTKTDNAKLTPPPGKKRGLTNEMRKAAAIRNADRKAGARARGSSSPNQTGGKQ